MHATALRLRLSQAVGTSQTVGIKDGEASIINLSNSVLDGVSDSVSDSVSNGVSDSLTVSLTDSLSAFIGTRESSTVCASLQGLEGLAVVRLNRIGEVRARGLDSCVRVDGPTFQHTLKLEHAVGSLQMAAPVAIRMRGGLVRVLADAPKYGAHTTEILGALHWRRLLLSSAAVAAWSRTYLPYGTESGACMVRGTRTVILACRHNVCHSCLAAARRSACPLCGNPHELDVSRLRLLACEWKGAYGQWRRGEAYGAIDLERRFRPRDASHRRTRSV